MSSRGKRRRKNRPRSRRKNTQATQPQPETIMKCGQTKRFSCDQCSVEFEICLEPKAKDTPKIAADMDDQDVTSCPFCGETIGEDDAI